MAGLEFSGCFCAGASLRCCVAGCLPAGAFDDRLLAGVVALLSDAGVLLLVITGRSEIGFTSCLVATFAGLAVAAPRSTCGL